MLQWNEFGKSCKIGRFRNTWYDTKKHKNHNAQNVKRKKKYIGK